MAWHAESGRWYCHRGRGIASRVPGRGQICPANRLQKSLNLALGSVLAAIGLTIPSCACFDCHRPATGTRPGVHPGVENQAPDGRRGQRAGRQSCGDVGEGRPAGGVEAGGDGGAGGGVAVAAALPERADGGEERRQGAREQVEGRAAGAGGEVPRAGAEGLAGGGERARGGRRGRRGRSAPLPYSSATVSAAITASISARPSP